MANMGNMVVVDAKRVRAIREYFGKYFANEDDRPVKSELMALMNELIERRAQDGDWPEDGYVTIQQSELFNGKDCPPANDVIDRMASEIHDLKRCVDEWRQRCYRNESADVDAVRLSMQEEINKRDEAIGRKDTLTAQMAVDDEAARTNGIAAHRRIAEMQSRLATANDQLEQIQGIIARRNVSIDAMAKESEEAKNQIAELELSNARKKSYIGKQKTRHAELVLQLRIDLDNMTESNRGHVITLKRAKAKLSGLELLVESEIGDFFAGFGSPGEPETPDVMQDQLLARILNAIAGD